MHWHEYWGSNISWNRAAASPDNFCTASTVSSWKEGPSHLSSCPKMAKMIFVVLLQCCFLILKIPTALCEKRKTIKIEKRGFPHGWDIGVRKYFDPGDQKEVTICMRFRTFSYNEGMGWPFHMINHCTDPDDMWQVCNCPSTGRPKKCTNKTKS